MTTIREMNLLVTAAVLAVASMSYITVDIALSVDPATRSSPAVAASSVGTVTSKEAPGRKVANTHTRTGDLDEANRQVN